MKKITPKVFVVILLCTFSLYAQKPTQEIGIFAGATAIQTDFGERGEFLSTLANNSTTIGVAHYLQFFDSRSPWKEKYGILDHIMIKTELSYINSTGLEHYGIYVQNSKKGVSSKAAPTSKEVLKNMVGKINMINFGVNIEYYLTDLYRFFYEYSRIKINPFVNLGVNYSFYHNSVSSRLGDWQENKSLLPEKYMKDGALDLGFGSTLAYNLGFGTRYKLSEKFDFSAQLNWQIFMSDAVDGLQAKVPENTSNETMTSIQVGIVYHLNFFKSM